MQGKDSKVRRGRATKKKYRLCKHRRVSHIVQPTWQSPQTFLQTVGVGQKARRWRMSHLNTTIEGVMNGSCGRGSIFT